MYFRSVNPRPVLADNGAAEGILESDLNLSLVRRYPSAATLRIADYDLVRLLCDRATIVTAHVAFRPPHSTRLIKAAERIIVGR